MGVSSRRKALSHSAKRDFRTKPKWPPEGPAAEANTPFSSAGRALELRFRRSQDIAATSDAKVGIKGALATIVSSAHFPKFVLHCSAHRHELRKVMGTSKLVESSTALSI